ncbi:MAG: alpha/beta fold hydrolase [Solirubrobacterales bacterium]|nr:alpha/beta fold hydrolase [Solirubrobacterales bacterium]
MTGFTPYHRAGSGTPLVLLHGFGDTWRTWELVLPRLERHHDVLALTLPGHAGGPQIPDPVSADAMVELLDTALSEHHVPQAHLVGNSLGGYLALRLAARNRATRVTALAPAGGWTQSKQANKPIRLLGGVARAAKTAAPRADSLLATPEGRRNATMLTTVKYEHIPKELLVHQLLGLSAFTQSDALVDAAVRDGWALPAEQIDCPVRIIWGTEDKLLDWPAAAERFQTELHAEWVVLDGVGHCPQLDVPAETADLILSGR